MLFLNIDLTTLLMEFLISMDLKSNSEFVYKLISKLKKDFFSFLENLNTFNLDFFWCGYLQKRSDWLKHWETYYFVLKNRFLYCYLNEEDYNSKNPEKY